MAEDALGWEASGLGWMRKLRELRREGTTWRGSKVRTSVGVLVGGDVDRLFEVSIVLSDGYTDATDGGELWECIGRRFEGRRVRFVLYVREDRLFEVTVVLFVVVEGVLGPWVVPVVLESEV